LPETRLLARRGRLEAIKRGRNWHTTRRAVEAYRRSVEASASWWAKTVFSEEPFPPGHRPVRCSRC